MTLCYIALGSNLACPQRQLRQAIARLQKLPKSALIKTSKLYFSLPYGVHAQPPYYNMVIALKTSLDPESLLNHCLRIEKEQGRVRKKHWGPRTLDIDLLLYGQRIIKQAHLIIPHPQMLKRDFVLLPLLEISPNIHMPTKESIPAHLSRCEGHLIPK